MKRTVLADTGPLYAAVDPDDEYHARAQRELKRLAREKREVVLACPTLAGRRKAKREVRVPVYSL